MDLIGWSGLFANLAQLPTLLARVTKIETDVKGLQERMTTSEQVNVRLDAVTSAMGTDIGTLRQKLTDLTTAINSGNQTAVSGALDALAPSLTNLETMEASLHTLGSDPANPVPATLPTEPAVDPNAPSAG